MSVIAVYTKSVFWSLVILALGMPVLPVFAQNQGVPTRVMVRAIAQDAKLIHDGVGGARITIRDLSTGQILSSGLQKGSSGDTERIMRLPRQRGGIVYDTPGAAGFLATITLSEPTMVEITAEGPLGTPHAAQRASKTMLLVPGKDILGDGVELTIHGFIVDLLSPEGGTTVGEGQTIPVRASVTMTCGCPTEPGGIWDSNKFQVVARLVSGLEVLTETHMQYAGIQNLYEGTIEIPPVTGNSIVLEVLAMDPKEANFGIDRREMRIR